MPVNRWVVQMPKEKAQISQQGRQWEQKVLITHSLSIKQG
jgi:hypothetical protein